MRALLLAVYRASYGGMPILLGLYIAHQWGLRQLASYSVAQASLAVAIVIADWGSTRFLPRELSRRDSAAVAVTASSTGVRLILASLCVTGGLAYGLMGGFGRDVLPFLLLLAPVAFASVAATNAVSARVVDDDLNGLLTAVAAGVLPVVLAAVLAGSSPSGALAVIAAYTAGKWIETLLLTHGRWSVQRISLHDTWPVFLMMLPFAMTAVMGTIYSRLPIFALESWGTRAELGIVSVGIALQNVLLLVPTASALLVYPRLTVAVARHDSRAFRAALWPYFLSSTLVFAFGMAVLWFARHVVCSLLDVPPAAATFLFFYVGAGCFSTVNIMALAVLQAAGAEHRAAMWGAVTLAIAIVLQVIAVRQWGMWGALGAVVVAEACATILFSTRAWRALRTAMTADDPSTLSSRP